MKLPLPITALIVITSLPAFSEEPTFSDDIAPIIFNNCTSCHRPGEAAPFSLTDYQSVKRKAGTIARVTGEGFMPPWHPEPGWGEFRGKMSLNQEQIDLISKWVDSGAPEGDPEKTPELPNFPEGWSLGKEPDVILEMDESFEIHAEGNDIYRYFVLPLDLPEDKWVRAVDVRPSARTVVHHVLFFLDNKKGARKLAAADDKPGFKGKGFKATGSLGGWAVGGTPLDLSEDFAMPMAKGSDLVLQTHFHPTGKTEKEKTKVGIYFADMAPEKRLIEFQVPPDFGGKTGLNVAPGESAYKLHDHLIVPEDMDLVTCWGHAHQICSSVQAEATMPDGSKQKLFRISKWQFNWQGQFAYEKPMHLPKGTRIDTLITYDNSSANPTNPFSPPHRIYWGEQSNDEMGSIIFKCVASDKSKHAALAGGLKKERDASRKRFKGNLDTAIRRLIVMKGDKNFDDRLEIKEVEKEHHPIFHILDANKDGYVTVTEVDAKAKLLDKVLKK